jgi:hypothetical protein
MQRVARKVAKTAIETARVGVPVRIGGAAKVFVNGKYVGEATEFTLVVPDSAARGAGFQS